MTPRLPSRYTIGRELGRGGMGVVYEADDERLGRKVAIKMLHVGPDRAERKRRFAQEARAASALNHPNIITVHDIEESDDGDFIVMELVDGVALSHLANDGPLPCDRAIDYATQIAGALAAAHGAGIVHRDLKPANVMVTPHGRVKVLDFGLSKWTKPSDDDAVTIADAPHTSAGAVVGTYGYMSPEQALAQPVDARTDVFSFGVLLYELLSGRRLIDVDPPPLRSVRPDVPDELARIVERCLEKDRALRYASAAEVLDDLRQLTPAGAPARSRSVRLVAVLATIAVAIAATAGWLAIRRSQAAAFIERSIPEIERLNASGHYVEAYRLARQALRSAPGDARVQGSLRSVTVPLTMKEPVGADLYLNGYTDGDDAWELVGRIPISDAPVPFGEVRWRLVKEGFDTAEGASPNSPAVSLRRAGESPDGMLYVVGRPASEAGTRVVLPDFWIDKYEVTNADFKRFVDAGGYRDAKYWNGSFAFVGQFTDRTGRPGPATWELGTFPEGQGHHPVGGVSWYEAAAYAAFVGKQLPTVFHWRALLGNQLFGHSVAAAANFNGTSARPVTALKDLGTFGTYGLAGNVKEWVWNATDDQRYVVGGAWTDPPYMAMNREARTPLDRHATHGFRCVRDTTPSPAAALSAIPPRAAGPLPKPVGDDLYATYRAMYAYDRRQVDARVESADESEHWRVEHISIAAAYGRERVPVHLLLPKNSTPPYQTLVWFPGGYAFGLLPLGSDVGHSPGSPNFTFLLRAGRAVAFPIYQGTFQRFLGVPEFPRDDQLNAYREMVVQWSKDLGRTIDYLETRPDIDAGKIGYYGLSAAANAALPIVAIESRLKAVVLASGGLPPARRPPEADPINFAPHIIAPTLMLNGRDDFIFPLETTARPLFALLGAPADRKRLVIHEHGHVPPNNDLSREVLGWLDKYLGPVLTR